VSSKRGKADFFSEEEQQQRLGEEQPQGPPAPAQASVERRSSGQRIRADLLRAYKILSAETGTPQYVLIEAALEEYLARKRP
jgi:hypothetical protein